MSKIFILQLWILLVLFISCKTQKQQEIFEQQKIQQITLDNPGCMGSCPNYLFSASRDGAVKLGAREFMDIEGTYSGQLSSEQNTELWKMVDGAKLESKKESYGMEAEDTREKTLTYRINDKDRSIHYKTFEPKELKILTHFIDNLTKEIEWKSSTN